VICDRLLQLTAIGGGARMPRTCGGRVMIIVRYDTKTRGEERGEGKRIRVGRYM
jgi:hypothetical protein